MFINKPEIEEAKQFSIIEYLNERGVQPLKEVGKQVVYYSPLTNEKQHRF